MRDASDLDAAVQLLSHGNPELERRLKKHQHSLETTDLVAPEKHRDYLIWRAEIEGEAIADYDTAEEHFQAGRRLEGQGYGSEAREQYEKAVEKDPDLALAQAGLGRTAFRANDTEIAAEAYRRALALTPDRPGWMLELGECYYAMNDDEKALEQFKNAVALKPDWPEAQTRLGTVYWRLQNYEQAHHHLSKAIELGGKPNVQLVNLVREKLGLPSLTIPNEPGQVDLAPVPSQDPSSGPVPTQ